MTMIWDEIKLRWNHVMCIYFYMMSFLCFFLLFVVYLRISLSPLVFVRALGLTTWKTMWKTRHLGWIQIIFLQYMGRSCLRTVNPWYRHRHCCVHFSDVQSRYMYCIRDILTYFSVCPSQVYPLLGFPLQAISQASEHLVREHQTKYAQSSRILQQVSLEQRVVKINS